MTVFAYGRPWGWKDSNHSSQASPDFYVWWTDESFGYKSAPLSHSQPSGTAVNTLIPLPNGSLYDAAQTYNVPVRPAVVTWSWRFVLFSNARLPMHVYYSNYAQRLGQLEYLMVRANVAQGYVYQTLARFESITADYQPAYDRYENVMRAGGVVADFTATFRLRESENWTLV